MPLTLQGLEEFYLSFGRIPGRTLSLTGLSNREVKMPETLKTLPALKPAATIDRRIAIMESIFMGASLISIRDFFYIKPNPQREQELVGRLCIKVGDIHELSTRPRVWRIQSVDSERERFGIVDTANGIADVVGTNSKLILVPKLKDEFLKLRGAIKTAYNYIASACDYMELMEKEELEYEEYGIWEVMKYDIFKDLESNKVVEIIKTLQEFDS